MSDDAKQHPLEDYPEEDRVAYLSILAAICYEDKVFSDKEKAQLDALLDTLKISDKNKARIYSSIYDPQPLYKEAYLQHLRRLTNSSLKYTLISDLCLFALADSEFRESEYQYILEIGKQLDIRQEQIDSIRSVQESLNTLKDIPPNSVKFQKLIKELASNLAGVGVPAAAIAASGSVFGLSAAGITSGLAALGAVVGGGMLMGTVLVVPAIAVGSIYGVKKLLDTIWQEDEPEA